MSTMAGPNCRRRHHQHRPDPIMHQKRRFRPHSTYGLAQTITTCLNLMIVKRCLNSKPKHSFSITPVFTITHRRAWDM